MITKKIDQIAEKHEVKVNNTRLDGFGRECYESGTEDVLKVVATMIFAYEGPPVLTGDDRKLIDIANGNLEVLKENLSDSHLRLLNEFDTSNNEAQFAREQENFIQGFLHGYKYLLEYVTHKS